MKKFLILPTFCMSVVLCGSTEMPAESPTNLSVISYNVQFLPPPASFANKRPQPDYRATRIAEEVSKFDIVGLQETFHPKHRQQILDGVSNAWSNKLQSFVAPQPDGFATNGGCMLLTQLPLVATRATVFAHYSKPEDYGFAADGFAAKGVIHGRIARSESEPNEFIDVYVTHLEARADQLRPKQYAEMADFIKQTSDPARPMILMGDLNTNGLTENRRDPNAQYAQLMKELQRARSTGVVDVWVALRGDDHGGTSHQESTEIGKRIDYILISNPKPPASQLIPRSIEVETYQDGRVKALSDHNAVIAEFEWTRR